MGVSAVWAARNTLWLERFPRAPTVRGEIRPLKGRSRRLNIGDRLKLSGGLAAEIIAAWPLGRPVNSLG